MILAGRHINDNMGIVVAERVIKLMIKNAHQIVGSKVAILGVTFKENCPDIRNSRVLDVIRELQDFGCNVEVYDPWADKEEVQREYGLVLRDLETFNLQEYQAVIIAVAHNAFKELDFKSRSKVVVYDLKGILPKEQVSGRL